MQNIFKKNLLIISLLLPLTAGAAPEDDLRKADSLFSAGRYIQAFDRYEQLMENQNVISPAMLLKMAFIKEGLGQIDQALYYLNIYYLDTTDEQVLAKMEELANKNRLNGYSAGDFELFMSYYYRYYNEITFLLIAFVLLSFSILVYRKRKGVQRPLGAAFVMILFLTILFYQINYGKEYGKGIISHENTYVMSGPSSGAKVLDVVSLGHRVDVRGYHDVWTRIEWEGETAYVRNKNLRQIRFL